MPKVHKLMLAFFRRISIRLKKAPMLLKWTGRRALSVIVPNSFKGFLFFRWPKFDRTIFEWLFNDCFPHLLLTVPYCLVRLVFTYCWHGSVDMAPKVVFAVVNSTRQPATVIALGRGCWCYIWSVACSSRI